MTPYQAVLFDFDGVLVDSEPVHFECWNEVLNKFGASLDWPTYERNCIGVSDRAMIEALCRVAERPLIFDEVWAEYPWKKRRFRERILEVDAMGDEVRRLIRDLAGMPLAVVTSSGRPEVEPVLEAAGVRQYFQSAVFWDDVVHHKPAPDPYLEAARRLGVARALVVEDSDAGVASGQAAGFDVLRVPAQKAMPAMVRRALGLPAVP